MAKQKTKTAAKKPAKTVVLTSPLSASELKAFKKELFEMRQKLSSELEGVRSKDLKEAMDAEPGDDADVATQTYEKEMLFEITGSERETLMQIDEALRRIENKTYGICDQCKKPIPLKRLRVLPYSRYCMNCQAMFESRPSS
ncbi:MAG: TraR/DksA family transcriptional regulator [Elusimicrobia bacterium]|nr:TraR/DksA family transcriptional regulator [Elusimicrobiota bacterium]